MFVWHTTAAEGVERTAKELIEPESQLTLETRHRVTKETERKEWTEYEGLCRLLLIFINCKRIVNAHILTSTTSCRSF